MSKHADYGIVLLSVIAQAGTSASFSARGLSLGSGLPLPMVAKILKQLTRAGILVSRRGVGGGYQLARSAGEVSVAAILEALDGPLGLVECSPGYPRKCTHEGACPVKTPLRRLDQVVRGTLEALSLQELVTSA